jgi:murein L,D-transpeptidase YcbB/YkuD
MPSSYNGWSAGPGWSVSGGQLAPLVVAGEPFSPGVRRGDVHTVLNYVANQLHRRVEPVVRSDWHQADDWGYAYRANVNNPSQLSCHASGTAIDYNATRHPNGRTGTWTAAQRAEIARIFAEVNNVVRNISYDEMHFEIRGTAAQVAEAARKVSGIKPPPPPGGATPGDGILELGDTGASVVTLQKVMNAWYPNDLRLTTDGDFGPATQAAVKFVQGKFGLTQDGIAGPLTLGKLGLSYLR